MKKIFTLFVFAILFSCNSSDETPPAENIDPTKLQKVVHNPGTAHEKHWNFYQNGLLKEITSADGTVLQSFTYDSSGNLLATAGHTFTYYSNIITTVDGYPVAYSYDSFGGKYTFTYDVPDEEDAGVDFPHKTEIVVNADLLPISRKVFYNYPEGEVSFTRISSTYLNGNLKTATQFEDTYQRYEFDSGSNPLKAALLPICRAMALTEHNSFHPSAYRPWQDGNYCSANNVVELRYALEDPESNTYTYTFNSLGLPSKQISEAYEFGVPTGSTVETIHYYYQGDDLP